ncbi:hypothetical protein P2318_32450 [Myxococcaceae bacterium GXIMD 01537]
MSVDRVGGGPSSMVADPRREESGWSAAEARAWGERRGLPGVVLPTRGERAGDLPLVERVDASTLGGEDVTGPARAREVAPGAWVSEELREGQTLVFTRLPGGGGGLFSCRLEVVHGSALAGFEPSVPSTLPVGSTLTLEAPGARGPRREVHRADEYTLRLVSMPSRGVVEEPFAGLLDGESAGGARTVERALGWTADLDLRQPGAVVYYREFLATGDVPSTHRAGGVPRSGRVALFTDSCVPPVELRFLRDFALLDGERVESYQRVLEYEDGGVEVRSRTRFGGGRQLFSTILVDTAGQPLRGDHSLVLGHLPAEDAGALRALLGERREVPGPCHARLRLTEDEALRWRELARAQVCELSGLSGSRFDAEARTQAMGGWKGTPQLISLALARTPDEVADALARLHVTARGLVECLVRLGAGLGTRLPGSLLVVPA